MLENPAVQKTEYEISEDEVHLEYNGGEIKTSL